MKLTEEEKIEILDALSKKHSNQEKTKKDYKYKLNEFKNLSQEEIDKLSYEDSLLINNESKAFEMLDNRIKITTDLIKKFLIDSDNENGEKIFDFIFKD